MAEGTFDYGMWIIPVGDQYVAGDHVQVAQVHFAKEGLWYACITLREKRVIIPPAGVAIVTKFGIRSVSHSGKDWLMDRHSVLAEQLTQVRWHRDPVAESVRVTTEPTEIEYRDEHIRSLQARVRELELENARLKEEIAMLNVLASTPRPTPDGPDLRDYFAANVSYSEVSAARAYDPACGGFPIETNAQARYRLADLMLAARKESK